MSDDAPSSEPSSKDPVLMPASPPYAAQHEPPWAEQWPPPSSPPPPVAPPPITGWPPPHPAGGPRRTSPRTVVAVVALLALLCAALGYGVGNSLAHSGSTTSAATAGSASTASSPDAGSSTPALPSPSTNGSQSGTLSASDIAQKVDTAIVDINVTFPSGRGAGTGMVLTSNGLVLTNNHVIANATKISVQSVTTDDSWNATVLGYSITDDVALLQLQGASGLTAITVGNSDQVTIGQHVVALGNALGQGGAPSISEGNVTQLNQSIDVSDEDGSSSTLSGLIETSARLQPGDSGGPLVDTSGSVIGMDAAATTSRRGRTSNDSFAIPINTALDVAHQIQSGQGTTRIHVGERGLLGVQANDGQSATVGQVEPDSPAANAGLAAGDTITSVDGHPVSSVDDIVAALDSHHPGDSVTVTWVDTSGQQHTANVKLIAGPPA
jgi:S1-C subfamily serine protease